MTNVIQNWNQYDYSGIGNFAVKINQSINIDHRTKHKHSRRKRFMGIPITSQSVSTFFVEVKKYVNLELDGLPSKSPALLPMLIEKAAQGIIEEGKQLGKQRKAEKIASILRQKKNATFEEIWKQCVYLYTSTNFLYKSLNSNVKLTEWKSKISTLGPFCLLLSDNPFKNEISKNKTIYRGANMDDAQISEYQQMAKDKNSYQSFEMYTSWTRNRKKGKTLGNTLFIMEILNNSTMDLSLYSKYSNEEEELIVPGVCFHVKNIIFDQKKKRYLINLELRQKVSKKVPISVPSSIIAKKHIFFAYAEDDQSDLVIVEKLKNYFVQRRFRVYHPRQNEDINTKIANGIEKAAVVLAFPSSSFEISKSGSKLLNYADQTKTPILTVQIYEDFQPMNWLGAILAPTKSCSTDFDEIIQSLMTIGVKTSDLILERGEKNESQLTEEYLFQGNTKSGNLKASYYQFGKEVPMKFKFLGLKNGKVFGQGDDKIGIFTLAGKYKIEDHHGFIKMQKQYVGKQSVKYRGKISFQELNCIIEGQWKAEKMSEKFFMHLTLSQPYTTHIEPTLPLQISRKQGTKVMISYCPCQFDLAQKITKGLIDKGIPAVCPTMKIHEMIKIAAQKARVVVPLMSQAYESSNTSKYVLSYVDEADIPIVPVKAQHPYSQSGWLGVICAGALYVQMTDDKLFEKKLDELITQLQPYLNDCEDQEEQDDILVDEEYVEGYYMQSGEEIILEFDMFSLINGYIAGEGEDDIGSFVINGEYYYLSNTDDLKFQFKKHYIEKKSYIKYSGFITEEDSVLFFDGKWSQDNLSDVFHFEAPVFDSSETERSHVMLSYQWGSQQFVKKIADKLKQKKIPIWFDIAGDMKGNINSAMAGGVENAAVVISFDTLAYSKSVNCQKEFTYAVQLEKTIVPVLLEDENTFQNTWLANSIISLEKLNMKNENQLDSTFDLLLERIQQVLDQEEKEQNDDNQSEIITRFEGDAVQGKYYDGDQCFDLNFEFFSLIEGKVSGQGNDDNTAFTIAGHYDNERNITFKEQYVGKHTVEYKGKFYCDEFGGLKIEGTWNTNNATGTFHLESIDDTENEDN